MVDMSPEAVTARLRAACEGTPTPKTRVPMDPASVTARLRSVSELRELCLKLGRGRIVEAEG
jgi:hypothetical protein